MSHLQRQMESDLLLSTLEKHPIFRQAQVVMMYCSLSDEVCTHQFIEKWSAEKTILLPVVKGKELELRTFVSFDLMETSTFQIEVPQSDVFLDFSKIDLIVVPGVAFTPQGFRLGRGGGYYDRFLSRTDIMHVPKIGICYPCQLIQQLPVESHDVPMDDVIGLLPLTSSMTDVR